MPGVHHLKHTAVKGGPICATPQVPHHSARRGVHVKASRPHARQHGLLLPKEQEWQILIGDLEDHSVP